MLGMRCSSLSLLRMLQEKESLDFASAMKDIASRETARAMRSAIENNHANLGVFGDIHHLSKRPASASECAATVTHVMQCPESVRNSVQKSPAAASTKPCSSGDVNDSASDSDSDRDTNRKRGRKHRRRHSPQANEPAEVVISNEVQSDPWYKAPTTVAPVSVPPTAVDEQSHFSAIFSNPYADGSKARPAGNGTKGGKCAPTPAASPGGAGDFYRSVQSKAERLRARREARATEDGGQSKDHIIEDVAELAARASVQVDPNAVLVLPHKTPQEPKRTSWRDRVAALRRKQT